MLRFISYGKGISILIVLFVHVFSAFFNSEMWPMVVRSPAVPLVYPKLVRIINKLTFDGMAGFIVVGAVCFFFLSTGYTIVRSVEQRKFLDFWRHKLIRLFPFYGGVLLIDFIISHLAAMIYGTSMPYTIFDYLSQFLMGLQYFVPGIQVLDPVIWFVGVDLFFCFYASIFRVYNLRNVFLMDTGIVFSILLLSTCQHYLTLTDSEIASLNFGFKSLALAAFMLTGTILSIRELSHDNKNYTLFVISQFMFFCLLYRFKISEIGYLDVSSYIPWFLCYLLIFICSWGFEERLPEIRLLHFFDKISFSLYISHGYIGYLIVSSLIFVGMNKTLSCLIVLPILIFIAAWLHFYIEVPLARFINRRNTLNKY